MVLRPNGLSALGFPVAPVRVLDFEGTQAAANWVDVTSTGTPSKGDAPLYGLDSTNALRITQEGADATYLARYRYYNAAGIDMSKSDIFTLALEYAPGHLPSRHRVGSSGTIELAWSSDGDGVFTNNHLITLGGGGTWCGLPEMGRNVWTWHASDMNTRTTNMASVKNFRLRLNTASAWDEVHIQGLWCGQRMRPTVCVTADDGWATQGLGAGEMCNIANARDIPMTLYVIPDLLTGSDGSTYLTEAEVEAIYAAGNAISVHGTGPAGLGDLTDYGAGGALEHVAAQQAWVKNNGYDWQHFCYPGGGYNGTVLGVMRELGFKTARTLAGVSYTAGPPERYASRGSYYPFSPHIQGMPNWLTMNACPVNNLTLTLAQMKAQLDLAIRKGEGIIFYGHRVGADADSLYINEADFTALMDYIYYRAFVTREVDVMTIPKMHRAYTG